MENTLQKYLGKELKGAISSIQVAQGTAKETGNIYYAIDITFINGYKKRMFVSNAEQFAWVNAFDQLDTQVQVNANF